MKTGVLLVNLGTPDSPSPADVRRYLKEFLWDPRVVDTPRPIWWLILNLVILNTRPRHTAEAYAKVWTDEGSPLLVISQQQHAALQQVYARQGDAAPEVALAMRYGSPTVVSGLQQLQAAGVERVVVLPLYPQYSHTTTASVKDAVTAGLEKLHWQPALQTVEHYYNHPAYIAALADSVRRFQAEHGEPDRLLLSLHGIPEDYIAAGDPYADECEATVRLLVEALQLSQDQWMLTYQSRLGPRQWLQPYTDKTLEVLAGQGVKHVQIICPGFSADCLETLEEVAMQNRDIFLGAGGETYEYIPCLNDHASHIHLFAELVEQCLRQ